MVTLENLETSWCQFVGIRVCCKQYDKVVAVGQKLKSKFNSAAESAKGALQKLGEAAQKRILQPILDKLKPFTDPIIEMAKKLQGVIMDNLKKIPGFDNILQVLKKKGINSLGDVGNIAKKVGGKALPVVGGIFNLMFAYDRLANGDTIGALLETLSAGFDLAGLLPGGQFGPPISMGIDAYMFVVILSQRYKRQKRRWSMVWDLVH